MKRLLILCIASFVLGPYSPHLWGEGRRELLGAWNSSLLTEQGKTLVYHADADGFVLPDFSHAGYQGGDADLPEVPTVSILTPVSGDNTARIQAAIDAVGQRPLVNGIRGALLLQAGTYTIAGTLSVPYSGVVLRGEGANTILRATGDTPHQRDVLVVGSSKRIWGATVVSGTKQNIVTQIVRPGDTTITVSNASAFSVGQPLIIYHPCTAAWLAAVNYGGVPYPDPSDPSADDERWTVNSYPIVYHRYINAINGNTLTLDAPVFYTLNRTLSQSYVYVPDMSGTITNSGVENLSIVIDSNGGEDENHAWNALRFRSCENVWAVDCSFSGFGQAGLVTEACRRSTFLRCNAVDPVGITTGERMYNFNTYLYSQLLLFDSCYARGGRHHFMSNGTSSTSGNVFLYCTSDAINSVNEGHRAWTQGMLYDNHREVNMIRPFTLGLYNRVAMGTGHGWAAVQSVLWNCDVDATYGTIGLQKPPTSQNYAIGCQAKKITGTPVSASSFTLGYVEGQNRQGLSPASLYRAQWQARHSASTPSGEDDAHPDLIPLSYLGKHTLCIHRPIATLAIYNPDGRLLYEVHHLSAISSLILPDTISGIVIVTCHDDQSNYTCRFAL